MRNIFILNLVLFSFISIGLFAQDYPEPFYLESPPSSDKIQKHDSDTGLIERILSKQIIIEYRYDDEGELFEYQTERWRVKMESDLGIEEYNKLYINLNNAISLEHAQARVTKPNGEVVIKDKDQMQEEIFEEYGKYYYFALEGLEIGSIIEFDYTVIQYPDYNGSRYIIQEQVPIYNFDFNLICPQNLIFSFNPIGLVPMLVKDSTDEIRNNWSASIAFLPPFKEEPYSNIYPNLAAYYYKLDENIAYNTKGITSYSKAAQTVYENLHIELKKGEIKQLEKIAKSLGISKMENEEEKIKAIELYIKTKVFVVDDRNIEGLRDISSMLNTGMADEVGMTMLFANWFKLLEIKYQMVLTCDRFEQNFDEVYESYNYLSQYLIYFPNTGEYINPSDRLFRYGLAPYELTENYGMFIVPVQVGDVVTAVPKIDWIEPAEYFQSVDSTVYEIVLDDINQPLIKTHKSMTGYEAVFFHGNMMHFGEDQMKEIQEAFIKNIRDDEEIVSVATENTEETLVGVKPLVFKGEITYPNLISIAEDNYLVNVGAIIGLQVELYQEHNRVNEIAMEYNHAYDRTIILNIPEGYEVKNAESLALDHRYSLGGEEKMAFVSNYEVKGNQLIVHNIEYYNTLRMGKEHFEGFKKVINAAADFNKAVVILTKK